MLEESHDAFGLWDEIGACPLVGKCLKLCNEVPFLGLPYAIKQDQNWVTEKELNSLEKVRLGKRGTYRVQFTCFIGERKTPKHVQSLYRLQDVNDKLVKVNHTFLLVRDWIQAIGQSTCQVRSIAYLWDGMACIYTNFRFREILLNNTFLCLDLILYLRPGMDLSVSPAIWQQFIDKVFENTPKKWKIQNHYGWYYYSCGGRDIQHASNILLVLPVLLTSYRNFTGIACRHRFRYIEESPGSIFSAIVYF